MEFLYCLKMIFFQCFRINCFIAVILSVLIGKYNSQSSQLSMHLISIKNMSQNFGEDIKKLTRELTGHRLIVSKYKDMEVTVQYSRRDGESERKASKLVTDLSSDIEKLLNKKVDALEVLVAKAEEANKKHTFQKNIEYEYVNNKKVLSQDDVIKMGQKNISDVDFSDIYQYISLKEKRRFKDIKVNTSYSSIHVPTNVYDKAPEILNGVKWSSALDKTFKKNDKDSHFKLLWQYFCSVDGFLRIFPGMKWPRDNQGDRVDMYDCRIRNWYIKGASSPKNMIILVDISGSMKGLRTKISRNTVEKLLETLSDDDHFNVIGVNILFIPHTRNTVENLETLSDDGHFNVIGFSKEPVYLDSCFNSTLMQASTQNKQNVVNIFEEIKMRGKAELKLALEEAFQLFEKEKNNRGEELCNKVIMIITDGAAETLEEVFKEYNWPNKTVRVFSYLIGREVKDNRYVKWMACANKGYYTHISTLADVQERVQNYSRVMSRPMGIARKRGEKLKNAKWTPAYADFTTEMSSNMTGGLKFVTSVSMPVFDTRNESFNQGRLLGVMGIDVTLEEIFSLIPWNKMGANAYCFMLTNHGYIMFHPNMKPMYISEREEGKILRPDYNTMDVTEMEYAEDYYQLHQLRNLLLNSTSGKFKKLKVKVPYERSNRVTLIEYSYYFASIANTPFKIVIALPHYGHETMKLSNTPRCLQSTTVNQNKMDKRLLFAPWKYCATDDILKGNREKRKRILLDNFTCRNGHNDYCSPELWVDITVRNNLNRHYGSNHDFRLPIANRLENNSSFSIPPAYKKYYNKNGIELLFYGTKNGLTSYCDQGMIQTDLGWIGNNSRTVQELYYKRAVEGIKEYGIHYTFSIPILTDYVEGSNMTVLSTMPVELEGVNVAVVGMLQNYKNFQSMFIHRFVDFTCNPLSRKGCFSCANNKEVSCYLLDNHGYIMMNNKLQGIGQFLGDTKEDFGLMAALLKEKIFLRAEYTNYQDQCNSGYDEPVGDGSAASYILNPLRSLLNMVIWTLTELVILIYQMGFSSLMYSEEVFTFDPQKESCDWKFLPPNTTLDELDPKNKKFFITNHCRPQQKQVKKVPCHKKNNLYYADIQHLARNPDIDGSIPACSFVNNATLKCKRTYVVQWIADTNLIFVAAAANCNCTGVTEDMATMRGKPVIYNDTQYCQLMRDISERVKIKSRYCYDKDAEEKTEDCSASGVFCCVPLLILSLGLSFLNRRWTNQM